MFKITHLFIYKILFVIEILMAMNLFSLKLKKKDHASLRCGFSIFFVLLIAVLFPLFDRISYTWWYSSLMFLLLFLACMGSMFAIYEASWQKIFFISISSYTIQHLSHEIYNILALLLGISENSDFDIYGAEIVFWFAPVFEFIVCMAIFILVFGISFFLLRDKINHYDNVKVNSSIILIISALILFTDIVFNSFVIYVEDDFNEIYAYTICLYNILCCFMVLFIQFSVMNEKKVENELKVTSQLLSLAEERYRENKENVNLINMKCHDLRHQIRDYGSKGQLSQQTIADLENMISIYDSAMKTGNESVDLILREKSLYCQKNHIKLTCLADCSKLGFIVDSDLYSLFGNALDNAIEAVEKITDSEKRIINLIVRKVEHYISISIENYFEESLKMGDDGLPLTTKQDVSLHGYGIKSIQYIVNKYEGKMTISTKEDRFSVYILFVL